MAQEEQGVSKPPVTSIASGNIAGDDLFDGNTVETGKLLQPEAQGRLSNGEDEELTVMRVLWDLYDTPNFEDHMTLESTNGFAIDHPNMDRVALGADQLYQIITGDKKLFFKTLTPVLTLPQLWERLESDYLKFVPAQQKVRELIDFGAVFELNNVSPRPLEMLVSGSHSEEWTGGDGIPEFVFDIPTSSGVPGNLLKTFRIMFFDDQFNMKTSINLTTGKPSTAGVFTVTGNQGVFKPSQFEWNQIADLSGTRHWVVAGDGLRTTTAFKYWSDKLSFQVNL